MAEKPTKLEQENLVFLTHHNPYLTLSKIQPKGLVLDLDNGTWSFPEDRRFGLGPFKIGIDKRYCSHDSRWGPIGVYDMSKFTHLQNLIHEVQYLSKNGDDNYDNL